MQLAAGDNAPPIMGVDQNGTNRGHDDFAGRKLVVYFYPRAFTPGCTTESCDFAERYDIFTARGYDIIGISPDEPADLARFKAEYNLPFDLLSDPDHVLAEAFGAWGTKKNYGREYLGIIRSTFLISDDGTIEQAFYNVRAKGHGERIAKAISS